MLLDGKSCTAGSAVAYPASRHRSYEPRPQLLDHRPHRPWEVDPGRSHPRAHRGPRRAPDARAGARLDGPRARARDHDQGAGGAGRVHGRRRRDLPPAPDRHPRARRLLLRGLPLARRLRGRPARRRRRAGRRGADRRQHLRGDRGRPRADPGPQQGRPAERRARAGGGRDRRPARHRRRRRDPHLGEDGGGRRPACSRRSSSASRRPHGEPEAPAAGADLRLRVRPVPRRRRLPADDRRLLLQARADQGDAERHAGRDRRDRLLPAEDDRGRRRWTPATSAT